MRVAANVKMIGNTQVARGGVSWATGRRGAQQGSGRDARVRLCPSAPIPSTQAVRRLRHLGRELCRGPEGVD